MAKRGREAMAKRARERQRQEKQEAKEEKRLARAAQEADETPLTENEESNLMEEFATLSRRHQADEISEAEYQDERRRIFVELGLESEEESL